MNISFQKRYQKVLDTFHQVSPEITTKYKFFLAGFIEGEGALCISIKKQKNSIRVDPEFHICQPLDGLIHLIAYMNLFKTGNISFKIGSRNTFVFKITNRRALKEKFIPYYQKFVLPYTCKQKKYNFKLYLTVLNLLEQKVHLTPKGLAFKILPLVYKMHTHKGKYSLESLQKKILN